MPEGLASNNGQSIGVYRAGVGSRFSRKYRSTAGLGARSELRMSCKCCRLTPMRRASSAWLPAAVTAANKRRNTWLINREVEVDYITKSAGSTFLETRIGQFASPASKTHVSKVFHCVFIG